MICSYNNISNQYFKPSKVLNALETQPLLIPALISKASYRCCSGSLAPIFCRESSISSSASISVSCSPLFQPARATRAPFLHLYKLMPPGCHFQVCPALRAPKPSRAFNRARPPGRCGSKHGCSLLKESLGGGEDGSSTSPPE